jgi:hypothetical protein
MDFAELFQTVCAVETEIIRLADLGKSGDELLTEITSA